MVKDILRLFVYLKNFILAKVHNFNYFFSLHMVRRIADSHLDLPFSAVVLVSYIFEPSIVDHQRKCAMFHGKLVVEKIHDR